MFGVSEKANEDVFRWKLSEVSTDVSNRRHSSTYMDDDSCRDNQTGQSQPVGYLFHRLASRAERRRSNIGATEVVHHTSDGNIDRSHPSLADNEASGVQVRVPHFRDDGEERRSARVGEDQGGDCRDSFLKRWVVEQLEVGLPRAVIRSECWSILDADRNGDYQDYGNVNELDY